METIEYKTGDVFHCIGHGKVSKGISIATRSHITHTAEFIDVWGYAYIFEAQKKGAHLIEFSKWKEIYGYEYIVSRSPVVIDYKAFSKKALSLSGHTGYDYKLFLLRYPFRILLSLITGKELKIKRSKKEDKKMICSELVAWCHDLINSQDYTPKKLYEYCAENNWTIVKNIKVYSKV